jgi:protein-S-isoprenylcysteine O-methyltransferase Ste14
MSVTARAARIDARARSADCREAFFWRPRFRRDWRCPSVGGAIHRGMGTCFWIGVVSADPEKPITSPRLVFVIIGATLAYLGLAVLGRGGFSAFCSHPALIVLAISLFALSGVALFSRGNLSTGEREDRGNRWVLVPFALIGLLSGYLPAYTDRVGFLTLDGDAVRWVGVVLFAAGGALRIWPVFVLGRRFSGFVAIQQGHALVTDGLYRFIRHPSYLGLLINMLGWALTFRSGVGVVLTALIVPPLLARIRAEERLLRTQFGAEYVAYCRRTSRLIPGVY